MQISLSVFLPVCATTPSELTNSYDMEIWEREN